MHNLKRYGRTFKGLAGECMFQLTRKNCFLTRFYPKEFVLRKFKGDLTKKQRDFLDENWLSFDALEFGNTQEIRIFEIKTKNFESYAAGNKISITKNTCEILQKAKEEGFQTDIAIVLLHDNWEYTVKIRPFENFITDMFIHTTNKFDKTNYFTPEEKKEYKKKEATKAYTYQ